MAYTSTGLKNAMLGTSSFYTAMDLCVLRVYKGTVPANADASLGTATLICTYTASGATYNESTGANGLQWETTPVAGEIAKLSGQTWSGTPIAAAGASPGSTATFFRIVCAGDSGAESTSQKRIQGTCGTSGTDLVMSDPNMVYNVARSIAGPFKFSLL